MDLCIFIGTSSGAAMKKKDKKGRDSELSDSPLNDVNRKSASSMKLPEKSVVEEIRSVDAADAVENKPQISYSSSSLF